MVYLIHLKKLVNKEQHNQQIELLKYQNKISELKLVYLKDLERRMKALIIEWRKTENKDEVIKTINSLLFKQNQKQVAEKHQNKIDQNFDEINGEIKIGNKVKMKTNRQVGIVKDIRSKKAIVQVGVVPIMIDLADLVLVRDKIL